MQITFKYKPGQALSTTSNTNASNFRYFLNKLDAHLKTFYESTTDTNNMKPSQVCTIPPEHMEEPMEVRPMEVAEHTVNPWTS